MRNISALPLFLFLLTLTSCEIIGDIFGAGFYTGIFVVVLLIVIVIWILVKLRRK